MPPSQKPNLPNLSLFDRSLILLFILRRHSLHLRPAQVILPTIFIQVIIFVWFAVTGQFATYLINNLIIVGLAILPLAMKTKSHPTQRKTI